jgi:hypothetical protein
MKLTESLDFNQSTLLAMAIPAEGEKSAVDIYMEFRGEVELEFNDKYREFLESLNLIDVLAKIETYDDVIRHETEYLGAGIKQEIAEFIDKQEKFSVIAKTLLFEMITLAYMEAGHNFCQPIYQKRLQQLAAAKFQNKRIITDV